MSNTVAVANNSTDADIDHIEVMRNLTREIALNDFGLPTGIYRTDLLPFHNYKAPTHHTDTNTNTDTPHLHPKLPAPSPFIEPIKLGDDIDFGGVEVDMDGVGVGDEEYGNDMVPTSGLHNGAGANGGGEREREREIIPYRIAGFPADELHNAFMPLQYDEGFPAFKNGLPFWGRLEYEPLDAFQAFQEYLQMSRGKRATIGEDEFAEYDGAEASGVRSISQLVFDKHPDGDALRTIQVFQGYYHLYYWGLRAHAYDLCRIAQHKSQQELRAIETLDEHYVMARRMRHKLESYMNENEDFWDLMTPKILLDMLKLTTAVERISAGVPAGGPDSKGSDDNGRPLEVHLRTIANTNRRPSDTIVSDEGIILDKALEDRESTELLQSLIIRTGS